MSSGLADAIMCDLLLYSQCQYDLHVSLVKKCLQIVVSELGLFDDCLFFMTHFRTEVYLLSAWLSLLHVYIGH